MLLRLCSCLRRSLLVRRRSAGGLSFLVLFPDLSIFFTLIGHWVNRIRLSNAKPFQRDSVAIVCNGLIRRVSHHFSQSNTPIETIWHPTCLRDTLLWTSLPSPYLTPNVAAAPVAQPAKWFALALIDWSLDCTHEVVQAGIFLFLIPDTMGSRKIFFSWGSSFSVKHV